LPPTRIDGASIEGSLVADGCVIEPGTRIENSIIGLRCRIGRDVTIRDSVVMGADFYETAADLEASGTNLLPIGIGAGTTVEGAIVDKNCRIGPGCQIVNRNHIEEGSLGEFCAIHDGILVVEKDARLPPCWHS
jgi:glucose-1-phosphate adenylyltransferase